MPKYKNCDFNYEINNITKKIYENAKNVINSEPIVVVVVD